MVGVPGRSKGCRNCRRRKKGCDLQQPQCGQCLKSKTPCEGYERELTFVRYDPQQVLQIENVGWPVESDQLDRKSLASPISASSVVARKEGDGSMQSTSVTKLYFVSPQTPSGPSLQRSMVNHQIIAGLWEVSYPLIFPKRDISGLNMGYWRPSVEKLCTSEPAVRHGLLAIAASYAGRHTSDDRWTHESLRHYGLALRETNRIIADPRRQTSTAVLAACKLLSLFEQGGTSSSRTVESNLNWDRHIEGVCRILRLRGARNLTDEAAYLLFTDIRMLVVGYGFKKRKRIFFEDPEWQSHPFRGRQKDVRQLLLDTAVFHPGLHEDIDSLAALLANHMASSVAQKRLFLNIGEKLSRLQAELNAWSSSLWIAIPASVLKSISGGIPEFFAPNNQAFAHTMTFYWTMVLSIAFSTCQLLGFAQQHPYLLEKTPSPYASPEHDSISAAPSPTQSILSHLPTLSSASSSALKSARQIAHSTPYFFQSAAGIYGPQAFSFPMIIALNYFATTHRTSDPAFGLLMEALRGSSQMGAVVKAFVLGGQKNTAATVWRERQQDGLRERAVSVETVQTVGSRERSFSPRAQGSAEDQAWFGVAGGDGEILAF